MPKKKSVKKGATSVKSTSEKRKRGWLLTTWMIILLIANILSFVAYILVGKIVSQILSLPIWTVYSAIVLSFINIILIAYLFNWKKWAFYGLVVISILSIIINIIIGDYVSSLLEVFGTGILYLILRRKWKLLV